MRQPLLLVTEAEFQDRDGSEEETRHNKNKSRTKTMIRVVDPATGLEAEAGAEQAVGQDNRVGRQVDQGSAATRARFEN